MNTYQQQAQTMAGLSPETIRDLEGVFTKSKLMALPGVIEVSDSLSEVSFVGNEDEMIDVANVCRIQPDCSEMMVVTERHIIVGGLAYDQDVGSPASEMEGEGKIHCLGRRGDREDHAAYYDALGLNSDGSPDYAHGAVCEALSHIVCEAIRKDRSLMTTLHNLVRHRTDWKVAGKGTGWDRVCNLITSAINQEGPDYAMDYIADWFLGVSYWADVADEWQEVLSPLSSQLTWDRVHEAYERALSSGAIGNPLAVVLDVYEHSGICFSISGQGMQCRWDTSRGGAVWIPDRCAEENIRYNAYQALGLGEVRWFGACGSDSDPLNARFSLDQGNTWIGEGRGWDWNQAMHEMLKASGKEIPPEELNAALVRSAEAYAKGCLETYNAWANGDVYGCLLYVIDRQTGERVESHDDEVWGHYGLQYAESELERWILNKSVELCTTVH